MGLSQLKQFTEMTPISRKGCKPNSVYRVKSYRINNNCNSNRGKVFGYQCIREGKQLFVIAEIVQVLSKVGQFINKKSETESLAFLFGW
ncbi:MAG TPA: hypothetical protein DCS93_28930 [Microscillaceae bacterium]|nr:hypothetical protein [Microscillaceae bacterium]